MADDLFKAQQAIQKAGSYSQSAFNNIRTKHPEAIENITAIRRLAVEELEHELENMSAAIGEKLQHELSKLRESKREYTEETEDSLVMLRRRKAEQA